MRVEQVFTGYLNFRTLDSLEKFAAWRGVPMDSLFLYSMAGQSDYNSMLLKIKEIDLTKEIFPLTLPESKDYINTLKEKRDSGKLADEMAIIRFSGFDENGEILPYEVLPANKATVGWLYQNYLPAIRIKRE